MKLEKYVAPCLALLFSLLYCHPVSAGTKRKLFKALVTSGGSGDGGGGSMPLESFAMVAAVAGVAFGLACAVAFFFHTWLISSLAAGKVLAVIGMFSFLAWPLFILLALPPVVAFPLGAALYRDMGVSDPNGALFLMLLLLFAAFLYFYLAIMILGLLSTAPWGKRMTRVFTVLAIAGGIAGLIVWGGIEPVILFLLCACCAWAAWKMHEKATSRAAAKKRAAAP